MARVSKFCGSEIVAHHDGLFTFTQNVMSHPGSENIDVCHEHCLGSNGVKFTADSQHRNVQNHQAQWFSFNNERHVCV